MSEQPPLKKAPTNAEVLTFIAILSLVSAIVLSFLASALKGPQEIAKELDRSRQMLIAAKIMSHEGNFLIPNEKGGYRPAKFERGRLVPGNANDISTNSQILEVYKTRIRPYLVDNQGNLTTFEKQGIDLDTYLSEYKKTGYYKEPYKLIYQILPNPEEGRSENTEKEKAIGYIIPVNGYGLWDAIYGYLALKPDGETVIGISWYDQKETPGLGANIADAPWQDNFPNKTIFQQSMKGGTDLKTAPIGITVVRGKVAEVLGDSPKAKSSVDGMPGATLTGNGVTAAYRDVFSSYRPFFIRLNKEWKKDKSQEADQ